MTAAALGVRSGGGGVSHSGRMSAINTLAQVFRQMQENSVEGLRLILRKKAIFVWKSKLYRDIITDREKITKDLEILFQRLVQMKGERYDENRYLFRLPGCR